MLRRERVSRKTIHSYKINNFSSYYNDRKSPDFDTAMFYERPNEGFPAECRKLGKSLSAIQFRAKQIEILRQIS